MDKPESELRAFVKTRLLKPGETQQLSFSLKAADLASFDTQRSSWMAEAGNYTIKIGNSSKNIQLTKTITLQKEIVVEKVNNVLAPKVEIKELKK